MRHRFGVVAMLVQSSFAIRRSGRSSEVSLAYALWAHVQTTVGYGGDGTDLGASRGAHDQPEPKPLNHQKKPYTLKALNTPPPPPTPKVKSKRHPSKP